MKGKFSIPIVCLALAGCAGTPPPNSELSVASARIADAERDGGMQYAPDDLTAARSKLDQAREAVRKGENKQAQRLAGEAAADAQLADVKARAGAQAKAMSPSPSSGAGAGLGDSQQRQGR